jgi:hypothetical protein
VVADDENFGIDGTFVTGRNSDKLLIHVLRYLTCRCRGVAY